MRSLLELTSANLDREHGPILAPMKTLEGYRFPGLYSLFDPRDRCLVQAGIEVARMHSDHLVAAVTQALTRLPVDVDNGPVLVEQEETIRRMIDEVAKALLARAQLIFCPLALGAVLRFAQRALDRGHEPRQPRLQNIVGCTPFQRLNRQLLAKGAGNENKGHIWTKAQSKFQCRKTIERR